MFSRVILTLHSLFNRRAGLGRMMPEQGGFKIGGQKEDGATGKDRGRLYRPPGNKGVLI